MKGKIFNEFEVQTIIAGMKTMFREVCKVQPKFSGQSLLFAESSTDIKHKGKYSWANLDEKLNITHRTDYFKPKFQVGQEIFVKETYCKSMFGKVIFYKDEEKKIRGLCGKDIGVNWKPASHMKYEQSRITLRIKSVKVERLQDINEEDCWKECGEVSTTNINNYFRNLWNSTHKKQEHKWEANPWVFVYEFEIINFNK